MPEFRQNLATQDWVILAPERGKRASDFKDKSTKRGSLPEYKKDCPFCAGNEDQTTESVYEYPQNGSWQVRVVPNKYAALHPDLSPTRTMAGMFLAAKGFGLAEVIIEHPRHNLNPAIMTNDEVAEVIRAYRQRQFEISKNDKITLVTIFRNHGPRAGTSLEHPHSQIIATPIVPPHVRQPFEQAVSYFDKYGRCVYCDMVSEEMRQGERIIAETQHFVAFCPYAARSPYEARIYPKRHKASFVLISNEEINELAFILRDVLGRIYAHLDDPDYNYIIRSSAIGDEDTRHLHWYLVIIPKVTTPAGFEIGSGIYINTVPPEQSAKELREARPPKVKTVN
jgi:UDPglucose--hexose-1-phosphate uridylyltransferase